MLDNVNCYENQNSLLKGLMLIAMRDNANLL